MKGLIFFFLILTNFAFGKIEHASFYFIPESVELENPSFDNIQRLKNSMKFLEIQLIEINLFSKKSIQNTKNTELNTRRIKVILELFNTQADIVSISTIGLDSDREDQNWGNRIDVYYSEYPLSESYSEKQRLAESDRLVDSNQIVDPRTRICAKPYRKPDLTHIVRGVPILIPIEFEGNTARFVDGNENVLFALRDKLNGNIQLTAHIRGHVCCGDRMGLSRKRAKKVYEFLIEHGIDSARLTYRGYSNSILLVKSEKTDSDRNMNRRVDVIFN